MRIIHIIITVFLLTHIAQAQQHVITLYQGPAPGSEDWDWDEEVFQLGNTGSGLVYNVSKPTLTLFEPDSVPANGTDVVICPGGGFQFLSMDSEGIEVARWLNKKGYTAFVLKYRLFHSLTDNPMQEFISLSYYKFGSSK
jgi:acetyl esterase/lipase